MMSCQQCVGIESVFNEKRVRKEQRRMRAKGPSRTTRMLIDALRAEGVEEASLIDIGGGLGAIQLELLDAGVAEVTSVDASRTYLDAAREAARERGVRARIAYVHGDFTDVADRLTDADVVTLDRVICCYDEVDRLIRASTRRSRRLYGLVYPREKWWTRAAIRFGNAYLRMRRSPMRTFVHPQRQVDASIRGAGFERILRRTTPFWQVVVYRRTAA